MMTYFALIHVSGDANSWLMGLKSVYNTVPERFSMILSKGDLVVTPSNESHAIKAIKYSEYLVFTKGPRGGEEYENDTFRLKNPLIS